MDLSAVYCAGQKDRSADGGGGGVVVGGRRRHALTHVKEAAEGSGEGVKDPKGI